MFSFEQEKTSDKNILFSELLSESISSVDLAKSFNDVKNKTILVVFLIKELVIRHQDDPEGWELNTPIPNLLEAYYCLLQIKTQLSALIIEPTSVSGYSHASKCIRFKQNEKIVFSAYVHTLNLAKLDLKTIHGIFLEPMEYC
ncbi:MAG: hypothetical protein Q8P81_03335 [Nanoarchaeota archaeon]|nr:hypothetical protein [Nanoarchaeota archaeon]